MPEDGYHVFELMAEPDGCGYVVRPVPKPLIAALEPEAAGEPDVGAG